MVVRLKGCSRCFLESVVRESLAEPSITGDLMESDEGFMLISLLERILLQEISPRLSVTAKSCWSTPDPSGQSQERIGSRFLEEISEWEGSNEDVWVIDIPVILSPPVLDYPTFSGGEKVSEILRLDLTSPNCAVLNYIELETGLIGPWYWTIVIGSCFPFLASVNTVIYHLKRENISWGKPG